SRRRHTRFSRDWSSDVCSSDLITAVLPHTQRHVRPCLDFLQLAVEACHARHARRSVLDIFSWYTQVDAVDLCNAITFDDAGFLCRPVACDREDKQSECVAFAATDTNRHAE